MKLREALLGCSSSQLSRMAAAWDLKVEAGTLRRELVEQIPERIVSRLETGALRTGLTEAARDVLRLLVRAGGRHESDLLARRLARPAPGDASADDAVRRIEATTADLLERGLLFRIYDADEQRRGLYLLLADEVLAAARGELGQPDDAATADALRPTAAPASVARCDLADDLLVLASALRREAWGAASRGLARQPARSVGQILASLRLVGDDGPGVPGRRWRFLLWVAQRAGWISREGWPTPDDNLLERLFGEPAALPARALAAGPISATPSPASSRPVAAPADDSGSPRRLQADALQLLSELDPDGWWTAADVARWLAGELADRGEATRAGDRQRGAQRLEDQIARWLAGRWFWLGLVAWGSGARGGTNGPDGPGRRDGQEDLGADGNRGTHAGHGSHTGADWALVSPTAALRAVVSGRSAARAEASPAGCLLLDALKLVAPPGSDRAALYRAERYLAYAGVGSEGGIEGRRYALTPASFDRGVRVGGDADDFRALLERLAQGPLPPTWLAAIEEWSSGAARLTLSARLILSTDRERTLAEALKTATARASIVEEISPGHAIVAGERIAEMLADLARAGLPVDVDPGLRAEPFQPGRAAGLANGVAEAAWTALEVLRRLAPEVVAEQRDLRAARGQLEAVLGAALLEVLDRRAATITAAIADRRRSRGRRGVV